MIQMFLRIGSTVVRGDVRCTAEKRTFQSEAIPSRCLVLRRESPPYQRAAGWDDETSNGN